MFLAQFGHSKNSSINKQEDTKNESSIAYHSAKHDNFFNALKALKPKAKQVHLIPRDSKITNTIGDNEISEYSKTNAHFSREEHEEYIMQKDIKLIDNCVKKFYHKRAMTSANIPYSMNIQPMLAKIIELKDEENYNDNNDIYTQRLGKKDLVVGSTGCDSWKHNDRSIYNNSFIIKDDKRHASLNEVIGLGLNLQNMKLDELNDLDEAKEIDLQSYRYNDKDKKLHISTID